MGKRFWCAILVLLVSALGAEAQYYAVNGACTLGGQATVTQGMASSGTRPLRGSTTLNGTGVMASYPGCTVTVFNTGTNTPAQLFSTNGGSAQSNPFTANLTDGSWVFFVTAGCYDITISSGATQASTMPNPHTSPGVCAGAGGGGGTTGGSSVTVNGTQAIPNAYNFTNTLLVPNGSSVVNFLLNGNTVGAYVSGGGGGSGTFPTTPLYDLFASTGSAAAQFSGIKGANGFLQGQVLTSTGDVNSNPSPFPALPNASVEYFPQGASFGGLNIGTTNGLAAYFSHSANSGATHNGGLMLGGGNSSGTNYQVYVDCESSPLGCDFKVPLSVNGAGVGSASLPTTTQYDLFASNGAGGAQASGVFGGPPGFLKTDVLVATGDITSVAPPFPIPANASVEYFPTGGYGLGATNGLAAYISHSLNTGANGAGGLALAGDSSDNIIKIYVDCETAPSAGCDFKVPVTVNGAGIGGGGGGITGVTSGGGLQITGTTVGMVTTCGTGQYLSWTGAWGCTTLNTGVTTINGNAGAFTFSGSGVSCSGTNCTFGGGSSGVNTGTVNVIPKYVTTTTVGPSLLTDNGTTLTYTGTGGIVAPSINITTGPLQFTSVTGALPAPPGAGQNGFVSGPNGWYYSNANGPYTLLGSSSAGVSSINTYTGAFTFTGAGVSCLAGTPNTCTFTGGGGATLPTTPQYDLFASTGAGAAQASGVKATQGFIEAGASIVNGTTASLPAALAGQNASQEWYAAGGVIGPSTNSVTVPNGAALFMGNSAGTGGATSNGGIVLGGNSASTPASKEVYVDCEHTGCGFYVPLTQTLSNAGGAIALSTLVPGCVAQNTPTAGPGGNLTIDSTNFPGGNFQIVANDTVLVELAIIGSLTSVTSPQFTVTSGGSTYTSMGFTAASGYSTTQLYHSAINGASPATSLLLTVPTTGGITGAKYVVCVAAYRNVGSIGTPQTYGNASNVSPSTFANFTTQTVNSVIFSAFSYGVSTTTSQGSTGTRLAGAATTTPSAAQGVICQLNAPTPGSQTACSLNVGNPVPFTVMGVELSPVSTGTPITAQIPHALSSGAVTYSDTVSIPISALCSPITCPAGIYRLSYYANVSTACTPGTLTIHSQYTDSVGAKTVDLMSTAFAFSSTTVPSSGSRVFQNSGTASITYSTTSVACSPGPGGGTFWLTLEQLQ